MNQINPKKLLHSKWTAVSPKQKERHFIVTALVKDENEIITGCELEAIINHNLYKINWQELKDSKHWLMNWK